MHVSFAEKTAFGQCTREIPVQAPESRREHDFSGYLDVPAKALWGIHTKRAVENFPITGVSIRHFPELGSHKGKAVRRAIRDVGARLVFLPKYSPDLNPIEQVFAKFKTLLRKPGAKSYEAVSQACAQILTQYPPEECAAYIRNAGYA